MKTLPALALALTFAVGSALAAAPAAEAATTAAAAKKPVACVATKTKPCPVHKVQLKKHTVKTAHKKVVKKTLPKAAAKAGAEKIEKKS